MSSKAAIDDFIAQPALAVAGASRDARKFGNIVYRELKARGHRVFAVNPNAEKVEGDPSYPTLGALPEKVGGVVIVTPPAITEKLVQDAAAAGISRVWMQQGAQSPAAIKFCQEHGISLVYGECIMMYQPNPAFYHNIHKFFKELVSGKPK
jgi:predicted CoA-binding protein